MQGLCRDFGPRGAAQAVVLEAEVAQVGVEVGDLGVDDPRSPSVSWSWCMIGVDLAAPWISQMGDVGGDLDVVRSGARWW